MSRPFTPPPPVDDTIVAEQVHIHVGCDEEIDPDEAAERRIYSCSRCGAQVVPEEGERARCSQCNIFCAKEADASCPQCEEPIELDSEEPEIVERTVWRTSDGRSHDSPEEAREYVDTYEDRVEAARAAHERMEADLARHRDEHQIRRRLLIAAIERLRAAGAAVPWAHDGWKGWANSMSVYLSAADIMIMLGLEPKAPETDEDFDRIWAAMVERRLCIAGATESNLAEPRMGGWYLRSWGSLWTNWGDDEGRDPSMTSMDTDEFIGFLDRWAIG